MVLAVPAAAQGAPAWRRLLREPAAWVGGGLVAAFLLVAVLAPALSPYDPNASDWGAIRQPPGAAHWFGTDDLGRDVLSRCIHGARVSLMAGFVSVAVAVAVGVPLGMLAGYFGGVADILISRVTDAVLACPFLVLAIALAAFLGPSLQNAMIAIGVSAAPLFVRLARGQTLSVKAEDYISAATSLGVSHLAILRAHVLPNIMPPLVVQTTLTTAMAVLAEASLAFLGLGQPPPDASWGSMLDSARQFLSDAPWMAVWPGLAIVAVVVGLNLLGDALNDALDPKD